MLICFCLRSTYCSPRAQTPKPMRKRSQKRPFAGPDFHVGSQTCVSPWQVPMPNNEQIHVYVYTYAHPAHRSCVNLNMCVSISSGNICVKEPNLMFFGGEIKALSSCPKCFSEPKNLRSSRKNICFLPRCET